MTALATIRAHIEQWRGLNYEDAIALLDIAENAGVRVEYGFPAWATDDPNTVDPWDMTLISEDDAREPDEPWKGPVYTRLVGPWQQMEQP